MTMREVEDIGRIRLSRHFFLRDFLYSEVAALHGLINVPDDIDLAVAAGTRLCTDLLEPLQERWGRLAIRSGYRSAAINDLCHRLYRTCARNELNHAKHIWDRRDGDGLMGATACIVIPAFIDQHKAAGDWRKLAWWIHDKLPYSKLCFYPTLFAFNISWHEKPKRTIFSYAEPRGQLSVKS